jgi:hypothetical protein
MNEVKRAFIEALEATADALEAVVGKHEIAEDFREGVAQIEHGDFDAKWDLAPHVEGLRNRARKLRRGDVKLGDWPLFRPQDASERMAMIEYIRESAAAHSQNEIFLRSIERALQPLREVIEKYAVETPDGWRFPEDSADPVPPFEPPPNPNIRSR